MLNSPPVGGLFKGWLLNLKPIMKYILISILIASTVQVYSQVGEEQESEQQYTYESSREIDLDKIWNAADALSFEADA